MTKQAYGSWVSEISPEFLTAKNRKLAYPQSSKNNLFWQEATPEGLTVINTLVEGTLQQASPDNVSIGTKANIYGGQAWTPTNTGIVYVDRSDQQIYLFDNGQVHQLSDDNNLYADFAFSSARNSVVAIAERPIDGSFPSAAIVEICLSTHTLNTLVEGADFYAFPRISNSGTRLCWMEWSLEQMSWEHSEVWCQDLTNHTRQRISKHQNEAVFQPCFDREDVLHWVSDCDNWWHIQNEKGETFKVANAELGRPVWLFGWSTYCFDRNNNLYALVNHSGLWQIAKRQDNSFSCIESKYSYLEDIVPFGDGIAVMGANHATSTSLLTLSSDDGLSSIRTSVDLDLSTDWFAKPTPFSFKTGDDQTAHAFFYAPTNPNYSGTADELPPVILLIHGGPTAATDCSLNFKIQFWTSRGYAVIDLNYRGSTGFGRDYRLALNGNWGVSDCEDVFAALNYAVNEGWCDQRKLLIKGSSAGGYTALNCLAASEVFGAAAIYYGVADLAALDAHTHKFEASYNKSLIGDNKLYPQRYEERSPINKTKLLRTPTIFFQGDQDGVVDQSQTDAIVAQYQANAVPHAYRLFAGEGHGFRNADTIDYTLKAEHAFYAAVLGFSVAEIDCLEQPLVISNGEQLNG